MGDRNLADTNICTDDDGARFFVDDDLGLRGGTYFQILDLGNKPRNLPVIARQDLNFDIVEIQRIGHHRSEVTVDNIRNTNSGRKIRIAKIEADNTKLIELVRYLALHHRPVDDPATRWHAFGHALRST